MQHNKGAISRKRDRERIRSLAPPPASTKRMPMPPAGKVLAALVRLARPHARAPAGEGCVPLVTVAGTSEGCSESDVGSGGSRGCGGDRCSSQRRGSDHTLHGHARLDDGQRRTAADEGGDGKKSDRGFIELKGPRVEMLARSRRMLARAHPLG